jgi:hypothetical protein
VNVKQPGAVFMPDDFNGQAGGAGMMIYDKDGCILPRIS